MKKDMHLYGTYLVARAAGYEPARAAILARSSMEVDCRIYEVCAFTKREPTVAGPASLESKVQWKTWAPFHLLPGLEGDSLEEKMICRAAGPLVDDMLARPATSDWWSGIVAHVLFDAYCHQGFSGIQSRLNKVASVSVDNASRAAMLTEVAESQISLAGMGKLPGALHDWLQHDYDGEDRPEVTPAEPGIAMGHFFAVGGLPDAPHLCWSFTYRFPCAVTANPQTRDNPVIYLDACKALYDHMVRTAGSGSAASAAWETIAGPLDRQIRDRHRHPKSWLHAIATVFPGENLEMLVGGLQGDAEEDAFDVAVREYRAWFKHAMTTRVPESAEHFG